MLVLVRCYSNSGQTRLRWDCPLSANSGFMCAMGTTAEIAGYTGQEVSRMRASLLLLIVLLACSSFAQAAPYDPYPWCAVYGGSWSGASNCGFKTLQQCMATVSGIGGSCEPNQFYNPGRSGRRAKAARPPYYGSYYAPGYGGFSSPSYFFND